MTQERNVLASTPQQLREWTLRGLAYAPMMRRELSCLVLTAALLAPGLGAAQSGKGPGTNTYEAKGCAQIGDNLVCGSAEIAAALAAALAAAQAAQAASKKKPKLCHCYCNPGGKNKHIGLMPEFECRALCVTKYKFTYQDYSCT